MITPPFAQALDWGKLVPLRLRAKTVADGVYAGIHRSLRRGAGVEFGGHRAYVPGDDLRWLDRHALMRHGRLMVREFETETDRGLWLVVDATASMAFRSTTAPGSKLAYAALLAAALGRIALSSGDAAALAWLGGAGSDPLPPASGRDAFERIVGTLERIRPSGDLSRDVRGVERSLGRVAASAKRGSVIILLSDLVDLPDTSLDCFAALSHGGRRALAVRVLDPCEAEFPFSGPLRLRAAEGDHLVETDADSARQSYLTALAETARRWREALLTRGGRLVEATTADDPVTVVRTVLAAVQGGSP